MSWWEWLKRTFFGGPQRDVSRLETEDVDIILETIDTSGKPIKEGHHRRGWRDPRLLPKKKRLLRLGKRKPIMSGEEARRLFSATLRNRDRRIRDLLPDEEQLQRFGLPTLKTETELAQVLGITLKELRFYTVHRMRDRFCNYVSFSLPKKSGGTRLVMAPKRRLKDLQRHLLPLLIDRFPVSEHAHGFRAGRSIKTGAEPHIGKRFLIHFDIKDFFPSLHFGRVRGYLIAMGYGYPMATVLAMLMTEAERQPVETDDGVFFAPVGSRYCVQGAPTSPGLANAIFLKTDRRLAGFARACGVTYTRYADDLSFSGDDPSNIARLLSFVPQILEAEGFAVNPAKTRVMRSSGRQTVTGVVVNRDLGLSRQERRLMRAEAHRLSVEARTGVPDVESAATPSPSLDGTFPVRLRRFRGKLAYLAMLNPGQAEKLRTKLPDDSNS